MIKNNRVSLYIVAGSFILFEFENGEVFCDGGLR